MAHELLITKYPTREVLSNAVLRTCFSSHSCDCGGTRIWWHCGHVRGIREDSVLCIPGPVRGVAGRGSSDTLSKPRSPVCVVTIQLNSNSEAAIHRAADALWIALFYTTAI